MMTFLLAYLSSFEIYLKISCLIFYFYFFIWFCNIQFITFLYICFVLFIIVLSLLVPQRKPFLLQVNLFTSICFHFPGWFLYILCNGPVFQVLLVFFPVFPFFIFSSCFFSSLIQFLYPFLNICTQKSEFLFFLCMFLLALSFNVSFHLVLFSFILLHSH